MEAIYIEAVGENHFGLIVDLAERTWPSAYGSILSTAQIEYMLHKFYNKEALVKNLAKNSQFFIAFENFVPIGFAELGIEEKMGMSKIHKLYVLPEAQGKHVGKELVNYCKRVAVAEKQTALFLNVNRYNKAKDFYEYLGFKIDYTEDIDIGAGYFMNDYVMSLPLVERG